MAGVQIDDWVGVMELETYIISGTQGADGALATNLSVYPLWPGLPSTLFSVFGYDSRGNRVAAINPKLNVTVSVFDGASRLIEMQRQTQTERSTQ